MSDAARDHRPEPPATTVATVTDAEVDAALADAAPTVFWSDRPDRPDVGPPATGATAADLVVVGGGFSGLWTALHAVRDRPGRRVVVLEADTVGFGGSTRNGGFCEASLTHGLANGLAHWPDELTTLRRLGAENLAGLRADLDTHGIDVGWEATGVVDMALARWQLDELAELAEAAARLGDRVELLDAAGARAVADSPTYLGGLRLDRAHTALVDPARLAWGLARALRELGVVIHERSPVRRVERAGDGTAGLVVRTDRAAVRADRVVVATNAWARPVRRVRHWVAPVYDHVLVTEPLDAGRMAAVGWAGREGLADAGNRFHYYRLTADDRILWGGFDATYHAGNRIGADLDQRPATHRLLARQLLETFPQLEGIRFTHRWGGPIATTSRFTAAWGTAHRGRLVWVAGYTGLGVGASRFGARVALDLVDGRVTEATELAMVRRRPFPFPPEPLRWPAIALTKRALARADENGGHRGPWLALLDRFGIGFDT